MNLEKISKNSNRKHKLFYNFFYDFVKVTGAPGMLLWLRPKVYHPFGNKTPKGAVLVSSNHRTFLDPMVIQVAFPWRRLHSLATKDLYKNRVLEFFFDAVHCIKIDKNNFAVSALHDVVERLEADHMVVIFPEGGVDTGKEDTVHAFKSGAVLMANKANAPILPVYIARRAHWYQRQRVVVGEPFYLGDGSGRMLSMAQLNEASEALREKELELRAYFESLPIHKKSNPNLSTNIDKEEKKHEQKV